MSQAIPYQLHRAQKIYEACTFGAREDRTEHVAVDGITGYVSFHPGRLASHAPEISSLLDALPPVFQDVQKGRISFVAA